MARDIESSKSPLAFGLMMLIAVSSGVRESVLSVAAFLAACVAVQALWRHRADWAPCPAYRELRLVAFALTLYFLLHAVRLDSERGWARLDGPVRAVLMAPLLALPWIAGVGWVRVRRLLALAAVVQGVMALAAWTLRPEEPRLFGFFTYHNLAAYSAVALFGVLACTREPPGHAVLNRAALALSLVAALLTGTVGALLGLPLVLFVAIWRRRSDWRAALASWRPVGALVLTMAVIAGAFGPRLAERGVFVADNLRTEANAAGFHGSGAQRLAMWKVSWAMIQDRPWQGQGLSAFPDQMQPWADRLGLPIRFGMDAFGHGGFRNPHHQLLGWAATLGVPTALVLLVLFWGVPLRAGWRLRQRARSDPAQREAREAWVALAVLMGLLLIFCQTESVIERQRGITWFLAWILLILGSLAVTASGQCLDEPDEHDQRRPLRS